MYEDNVKLINDLLVNTYHYSPSGAKAIMTNMIYESNQLDPKSYNPNSGAGGICQWTGDRVNNLVNYCNNNGLSPTSIEGQVAFMDHELQTIYNGYAGVNLYDDLQKCTDADLERCTVNFCAAYEAPDPGGNWQANEEIGRSRYYGANQNNYFSVLDSTPASSYQGSFSPMTGPDHFVKKLESSYTGRYSGQDAKDAIARLETQYTKTELANMSQEEFNRAVDESGYYGDIGRQFDFNQPYSNPMSNRMSKDQVEFFNANPELAKQLPPAVYNLYIASRDGLSDAEYARLSGLSPELVSILDNNNGRKNNTTQILNTNLPSNKTSTISTALPFNKNLTTDFNPQVIQTPTTQNTNIIQLNINKVTEIMSVLNTSINELEALINKLSNEEINKINNSWVADEAKKYVDLVVLSMKKEEKVSEMLKLLLNTYKKSLTYARSTKQSVNSTVTNI